MKYRTPRHVKQALLNGVEVKINKWAALINKNDEIEIWDPKGKGVVASLVHLDRAVVDFYRVAQGIPEKMPKPVTYESTPSGSGPLGDDTSQDKPWTDPKVNKQPVMQGPTSDPDLKDDTSQDPPWTDPEVNTRPMPEKGRGGLPDTDLGKDTQKNDVEWEDKLTGPEVFRMAREKRAEGELDILKNVSEVIDSGDTFIDMSNDQPIHVGLIYDTGEGFSPNIYAYLMHGWGSEDEALQGAFEWKEEQDTDRLDEEGWAEREKSMEEGFDSMTETYDGLVLTVTPEELYQAVKDVKAFDIVEFEGVEEEPEEELYWGNLTTYDLGKRDFTALAEKIADELIIMINEDGYKPLQAANAIAEHFPEASKNELSSALTLYDSETREDDRVLTSSEQVAMLYAMLGNTDADRSRKAQDMDPGDSGKEEMGTTDPDTEFHPEIEYEPHQIENKGEAPSNLPNDLGGRNNARRKAQQGSVGDFIWEKLSIFEEWWETDAGSHYWRDFESNVNAWIDTIEEAVKWAEESGTGDVSQVDAPAYIGELASILFKLGPEGVTQRAFQVQLEDIQNEAIDFAFETMTTASRRGFVDTFDREATPKVSYQDLVNASPSRDLLTNIADPEKWAATQVVKSFASGMGRGLYKDPEGKRDKANKGMTNMQGKDPDEVEAGCDYPEKKKKSRRKAQFLEDAFAQSYIQFGGMSESDIPGLKEAQEAMQAFEAGDIDKALSLAHEAGDLSPKWQDFEWELLEASKVASNKARKVIHQRRQAGPKLKENWTTDGGYTRDIEAETPEELYHLTRSFGSDDDYDWSSVRPQQQVAEEAVEDPGNGIPMEARKALDDKGKSYWRDYFGDYGEDLVKDDSTKKNRKELEPKVEETPKPAGQQKVKAQAVETYPSYTDEEGDVVYQLPFEFNSIEELMAIAQKDEMLDSFLWGDLQSNEGVESQSGAIFWGADVQDAIPRQGRRTRGQAWAGQPEPKFRPGDVVFDIDRPDDLITIDWIGSYDDYLEGWQYKGKYEDGERTKFLNEGKLELVEEGEISLSNKQSRRRTRGQAAPAAPPEAAPPGGQMTDPETAPQTPAQGPAAPAAPAKPEKAPGAGDEGLKALGWTPDEIKLMNDEDKQKILQVQLKKPGTGAAQAPTGQPAQKPPAKPVPEAPQSGPAPMPAQPEQGMPAPTARRLKRQSAEKLKIAKAFRRLAQAAPVQTGQTPPAPQTSPGQPVTAPGAPAPSAPAEPAVAEEFAGETSTEYTPETEAMSIYNEILQKEVKASSPEQVPALKSQELVQRLLTEVGMPMTEARQLFGLKSGDGFNKLFQ